ncbi:hypothetical protein BDN72DRAFT_286329 [Pluteus cervinus]|uniref:Uncharacterized protein n=1 Tax=Pluteus cervinus TaxID=181527 RepID=A0ACD3ADV7_9AGAR|nr:hypothetical protein BDN72DRAFT_286329 [Pluteus cervinus]
MSDTKQDKAQDGLSTTSSTAPPLGVKKNSGAAKADAIAELKNGKVIFKQKPLSFEKQSESLQEIVSFREMLEQRIERSEPPLLVFPSEYKPLIAKLAHESDKILTALTKYIHHELMPTQDDDEQDDGNSPAATMLPFSIVETAIKEVVTRNNYGLDGIDGTKPPAVVCVWRWEVPMGQYDWLPKNSRQKAESRLTERIQAKKTLAAVFQALSPSEQEAIIGTAKPHPKQKTEIVDLTNDVSEASPAKKARSAKSNEDNAVDPAKARPKKPIDPEKSAKEKERQEKKAAKAEKEKKEKDSQNKARSMMANFFSKPKTNPSTPTNVLIASTSSTTQSEFEKIFKPFVLKKDSVLAPSNYFVRQQHDRAAGGPRDVESVDVAALQQMTPSDHIRHVLSSLPLPSDQKRLPRPEHKPPSYKSYNPISIRSMLTQLSEAEVTGDISRVRSLLGQLTNRKLFPAKILIFHQDARPGYYGTWTRSSRHIGPRTPFARDPLEFDYGYDSGEEWEVDAGEADDVVDDGEEDDPEDEADSDVDSWLVDDDEEPDISMTDFDLPLPDIDFSALPPPPKRKADDGEKKTTKKRKVVIPLVAFASGPCWESKVGQCSYEPFEQYRIQLFNDTPYPINPFTFVSTCVEDSRASQKKPAQPSENVFAVPQLPNRVVSNPALASTSTSTKKPTLLPKTPFPDAHLQFLLSRITDLQSPTITFLVDAIYHELRAHKVKKNAIEAKVREVGERCKEKKFWVIKPEMIKLTSQS